MGVLSRAALLAAGLAVVLAQGVQAYPIAPVPLWSLVERSETIVVAEVVKVTEPSRSRTKKDGAPSIPLAVATLRVLVLLRSCTARERLSALSSPAGKDRSRVRRPAVG